MNPPFLVRFGLAVQALDIEGVPKDYPSRKQKFDDSEPLVFTHQDLNLRNIIMGDDGRLWIVD